MPPGIACDLSDSGPLSFHATKGPGRQGGVERNDRHLGRMPFGATSRTPPARDARTSGTAGVGGPY